MADGALPLRFCFCSTTTMAKVESVASQYGLAAARPCSRSAAAEANILGTRSPPPLPSQKFLWGFERKESGFVGGERSWDGLLGKLRDHG